MLGLPAVASEKAPHINFERALYLHLQENYLDAISLSEVLTAQNKQTSIQQQVLLSKSYFQYQLPEISLTILKSHLNSQLSKSDQDILLFTLAKNYYTNQQYPTALTTLSSIKHPINPSIQDELNYLLADIYIRNDALQKAEKTARLLKNNLDYFPYIAHNLAIALLNKHKRNKALVWINQLDKEQYSSHTELKNSLLLSLGISYLRDRLYEQAIELLLQIKKDSNISSKGLLALGTALVSNNNTEEGHRFYNYLSNYPKQNLHYQESLLYLAESSPKNAAQIRFKHAISTYDDLLAELATLTNSSMSEELSACLLNKSVNEANNDFCQNTHLWLQHFKQTPRIKQVTLQQKQLSGIQQTLASWNEKILIYEIILNQRKNDFDTKLPTIKNKFNPAQLTKLTQQFTRLKSQVNAIKHNFMPFSLVNEEESDLIDDINYVEVTVKRINNKEAIEGLKQRAQFTKGILMWDLAQQTPTRLRQATKNINEIEQLLAISAKGMEKLQQFSNNGDIRLTRLSHTLKQARQTLERLNNKVEQLLKSNQHYLATLTQNYLLKRRATLIQLNSRSKYLLTQLQDVQP